MCALGKGEKNGIWNPNCVTKKTWANFGNGVGEAGASTQGCMQATPCHFQDLQWFLLAEAGWCGGIGEGSGESRTRVGQGRPMGKQAWEGGGT